MQPPTEKLTIPNPSYSRAASGKKGIESFLLTAVSVGLVVLVGAIGEFLTTDEAAAMLPAKYLLFAPLLAAIGRYLVDWARHRKVEIEVPEGLGGELEKDEAVVLGQIIADEKKLIAEEAVEIEKQAIPTLAEAFRRRSKKS